MASYNSYLHRCSDYLKEHNIQLGIDRSNYRIIWEVHLHHLLYILDLFRQDNLEIYKLNSLEELLMVKKEDIKVPYDNIKLIISDTIDGKAWKIYHHYICIILEYRFIHGKLIFGLDTTLEQFKRFLLFEPTYLKEFPIKIN
jgi:hypothetical protein